MTIGVLARSRRLVRRPVRAARDRAYAIFGTILRRDQPSPDPVFTTDKSVLFIEGRVPRPDHNAGDRNIYEFLQTLRADGWSVAFWPMSPSAPTSYVNQLVDLGVTVVMGRLRPTLSQWLRRQGRGLRQVVICRPDVADIYLSEVRANTGAHISYYGHDLHFARMKMQAEVSRNKAMLTAAEEMERLETGIWERVDVALYPTETEVVQARATGSTAALQAVQIFCFDHFVTRTEAPAGKEIVFVASFRHAPNVDAATWFCREIMPAVSRLVPDATAILIGSSPTADVIALGNDRIQVRGWVSDDELRAAYERARLAVVPLRYGAGLKLKVVEALAYGVPLVTTSVGAQGLENLDQVLPIHDDASELAAAMVQTLQKPDSTWLAQALVQARYGEERFSRRTMLESLKAAFATPKRH